MPADAKHTCTSFSCQPLCTWVFLLTALTPDLNHGTVGLSGFFPSLLGPNSPKQKKSFLLIKWMADDLIPNDHNSSSWSLTTLWRFSLLASLSQVGNRLKRMQLHLEIWNPNLWIRILLQTRRSSACECVGSKEDEVPQGGDDWQGGGVSNSSSSLFRKLGSQNGRTMQLPSLFEWGESFEREVQRLYYKYSCRCIGTSQRPPRFLFLINLFINPTTLIWS